MIAEEHRVKSLIGGITLLHLIRQLNFLHVSVAVLLLETAMVWGFFAKKMCYNSKKPLVI